MKTNSCHISRRKLDQVRVTVTLPLLVKVAAESSLVCIAPSPGGERSVQFVSHRCKMTELKKESPEKSYMIKTEIGRGKFAVVKKCNEKKTRKQFAAKLIKYEDDPSKVMAVREFEIWSGLKNDKIVMARDGYILHKYVVVIMDFFEMKDCLSYLAEKPRANEEDAAIIIRQLLDVLKYLHSQNVIHLDIRPANVFMQKDYTLKLIDFGCARKIAKMETGEVVDAIAVTEFTAPEVLNFESASWGADMWSVGVLVYIFMGGVLPFTAEDEDECKALVSSIHYEFGDQFKRTSPEAKGFIKQLLLRIPEKRKTAAQCLEDPWLKANNAQRRKQSEIPAKSFKELNQKLIDDEKDELVVASCVLRTLDEDPYDSPEDEEEE